MVFEERVRASVRTWEPADQQHKHGAPQYALEDFGLTREQTTRRFAQYIERFRNLF